MTKKIFALALALMLCVSVFAGCQSTELGSYTSDAEKQQAEIEAAANLDYTPCYESYPDDKVMLTVAGQDVTWGELFYWMVYEVQSMASYGSPITDWDAECTFDTSKTNREFVQGGALETVKQYNALLAKAAEAGVKLTAEDEETLKTNWQTAVDTYGGGTEEGFEEYLAKAFMTKATYDKISRASAMTIRMQEETYGSKGEKLSEQEVLDEANALGYMRVKHIYFGFTDKDGNALTDEQKAEKKATAEGLVSRLNAISAGMEKETAFDAMMNEYSEDPGLATFPDGYTFIYGAFNNEPFESAAQALGEYEVSGVVEATNGYHVILRLPLSTTAAVVDTSSSDGNALPYYAAQSLFQKNVRSWAEEAEVVETNEYKSMDIAKVFGKAVAKPVETAAPAESTAPTETVVSPEASAAPAESTVPES